MEKWTHFDSEGKAHMVDVSNKAITERVAIAEGSIILNEEAFNGVKEGNMKKGDVLGIARIAGIMGAKRTSDLIPLCHPLAIRKVSLDFTLYEDERKITAQALVKVSGQTGVEMEALTAVQVALLTIYDMCKAVDRGMVISNVHLCEKSGGKSGHYVFPEEGE